MHHFMLPKLRLVFRNEHAQSTCLGPKLSFWMVSRDSVAGRYKLRDRVLGCIKCTTLCFRSCILFSQRTCPIHFFRPKTKFLGGFARFRCREVQVVRSGFGVHKMQHYVLPKLRLVFSLRSCPIHFFRSGWFRAIPLPGGTRCENGFWGAYNAPLYASEVASCFFATNAQSTSLGPKLSF